MIKNHQGSKIIKDQKSLMDQKSSRIKNHQGSKIIKDQKSSRIKNHQQIQITNRS